MNYYLNENDRIAADFNVFLDEVANTEAEYASSFGQGAIAVINLLNDSWTDLHTEVVGQAVAVGVPVEEADAHFEVVFNGYAEIIQPRLDALEDATRFAQGFCPAAEVNAAAEVETIERTDMQKMDDMLEELFTSLIGADAAAQVRANVEASDAAKAVEEEPLAEWEKELLGLNDEAEDEVYEVHEKTEVQAEVDDFMRPLFAALFGEDVAAQCQADVTAARAALAAVEPEDDEDPEANADAFNAFMASLFGVPTGTPARSLF